MFVLLAVIILCLPLIGSTLMDNLLVAINTLKLAHLPNTTLLAIHLTSSTPFISSNAEHLSVPDVTTTSEPVHSRSNKRQSPASQVSAPNAFNSAQESSSYFTKDEPFSPTASKLSQTGRLPRSVPSNLDSSGNGRYLRKWRRYSPPEEMSQSTKRAMLVLTVTDVNTNVEEYFSERRQNPLDNSTRYSEVSIAVLLIS